MRSSTLLSRSDFLSEASGPVAIRMSNDFLFHVLLQRDNEALAGLVRALLHLKPQELKTVVVTNPIELGASSQDKEFILDVKLLLNDNTIVNLELQVVNHHNWPERSLSYLCRAFDSLNPKDSYLSAKSAIHIGLLDFTLFPDRPEFYATYQMRNVKNHALYSDKLRLSVVDLNSIHLATEEDRRHHIDKWASFFKATTWEEIKMIASKDESITNAANTVWKLSQAEEIRLQCEAREDRIRNERDMQLYMERQKKTIAEQKDAIAQKDHAIAQKDHTIAEQKDALAQQADAIARKDAQISRVQQQQTLACIRQIRNFFAKSFPASDCAAMLDADLSLVETVYEKIRGCPAQDDAGIYSLLKDSGAI